MPLSRLLRWLSPTRRAEDDIREELSFHLSQQTTELQESGLTPEQARRAAHLNLGNVGLIHKDTRAVWISTFFEQLLQDLRYAFRAMAGNPGFTSLAVLSMALGIGANSAIYSFMDSILLRSLPVADPESLVVLNWYSKGSFRNHVMHSANGSTYRDATYGTTSGIFPYPAFERLANADRIFSSLFAHYPTSKRTLQIKGQALQSRGTFVSGEYFRTLAVKPAAGRLLLPSDDRAGASPVAVLSAAFANRRFGSPANAIGQAILIDNVAFTVAGVTPPDFFGVDPGAAPEFYVPLQMNPLIPGNDKPDFIDRNYYWLELMGRLRPGVTKEQAQAALAPLFNQWVVPTAANDAERANLPSLLVAEGAGGLENLRRQYARPLYVLLAIAGLILALACANTANLLLARASARRREIAVRLSVGAGRLRVIRQLLTESLLLAFFGGALGIAVAQFGIRFLTLLLANGQENFTLHAELNWNVLAAATALSLICGILFGLAPAMQATRADVVPALKETRGSTQSAPARFAFLRFSLSHVLIASQIAISVFILVGAGLFLRTLANLHALELNFNRENVLLFQLNAKQAGHRDEQLAPFYSALHEQFSAIPGVRAATLAHASLLEAGRGHNISVDGVRAEGARFLHTGPAFFSTMEIPILLGRGLDRRDLPSSTQVAVINDLFAKKFFSNANPLGRHVRVFGSDHKDVEVVGVCANARYGSLKGDAPPVIFLPYVQSPPARVGPSMTFALRTAGDPTPILKSVHDIVARADSRVPVTDVRTQAAEIDRAMNQERVFAQLCTGFAILALVISCVGLYGTMSYNVARRTSEIGIRMALGAQRVKVLWMILRDALALAALGLAIGLPAAYVSGKYIESFLFGMKPNDPTALALAVLTLLCAILLAGFIPAQKATRIDPITALRQE